MIALSIILCTVTGMLMVWLCGLHKQIHLFEQLALGFVTALSIFVLELFVQGVTGTLSRILPAATCIVLLGIFLYKSRKATYRKSIGQSFMQNMTAIRDQFTVLPVWQKILITLMFIYVVVKLIMLFGINTHMPTFDEDAVGGRDLKTKIFAENRSLVLDSNNPEFLGSALERNIFAPLTDTYFLLGSSGDLTGFTNIVSPLFYLVAILALMGIFIRRANIFYAMLSAYVFTSLPFVFVHGFSSYRNLASGVLLFIWIFYIMENFLLHREHTNKNILYLLLPLTFLVTTARNESFILACILIAGAAVTYRIINRKRGGFKSMRNPALLVLGALVICYLINKSVVMFYPEGAELRVGVGSDGNMLQTFLGSLGNTQILTMPFNNAFYHSDYNLIFLLIVLSFLYLIFLRRNDKELIYMFVFRLLLVGGTIAILFSNLDLGILTHFSFVRFGLVFLLFSVYIIIYSLHAFFRKDT